MECKYYYATVLDEGSYVDYGLLSGSPSICWWMIPGTWKDPDSYLITLWRTEDVNK